MKMRKSIPDATIWLRRSGIEARLTMMTEETLPETLALRQMIREQMEHPRWFAYSGREDFAHALQCGFALNCVVEGKVIASVQCVLEDTEYAKELYQEEEDIRKCADYSDVFVHPDYRGNGLQRLLEQRMEEICAAEGKKILLGTVDPENLYSYRNFIRNGYEVVVRKEMYGGLDRYLMRKELKILSLSVVIK